MAKFYYTKGTGFFGGSIIKKFKVGSSMPIKTLHGSSKKNVYSRYFTPKAVNKKYARRGIF